MAEPAAHVGQTATGAPGRNDGPGATAEAGPSPECSEPARDPARGAAPRADPPEPRPGDSMVALRETARYRDAQRSRPPPLRVRSWRAYWITFLVIGSYLW